MPEMLELIESLRVEEADVQSLFGDEGRRVRESRPDPGKLLSAARLMEKARKSRRAAYLLSEAMSTSDFPILAADILDRQMLGFYEETTPTWQAYVRRSTVNDFRNVKRFAVDGAEGALGEVDQGEEYPEASLKESKDEFNVRKFGRRISLFWEAMVNDDMDAFSRNPERLARAARRSESKFATELWVGAKGPDEGLYKKEFGNVVEVEGKQPPLSIEALEAALVLLSEQVDEDDEPINIDMVTLVVPPALRVTALNILNAISIDTNVKGGNEKSACESITG